MISYFISYVFQGPQGIAAGNCTVTVPSPISTMDDVNTVTRFLASQGLNNACLMSFTRFDGAAADREATR
jgi:hypothetical protein